jgi:DNA-binding SARP family transcriptional activator
MYAEAKIADRLDDHARGTPDGPACTVRFTVLGSLEVRKDGVDYAPTTPKLLQLLAMLILQPGKTVNMESIVHELWASDPPRSVRPTMHTYAYHLRRHLRQHGLAEDPEKLLITKPPGYLFRIDPAQVDVFTFRQWHREGTEHLARHRYTEAARCFRSALDLWTGPPLANVHSGPVLSVSTVDLLEQRRSAQHLRIEAEIAGGLHRELIGELRSLVAANPLDEGLHGQLMRVLGRSGRRSDAMASFRQLRIRLQDELGVEPCDELQLLHHDLLSEGEKTA